MQMIMIAFLDRVLDALGLYLVVTATLKIAKGYPIKRWFF